MPKRWKPRPRSEELMGSPPPTVRVMSSRYQPSKKELEEETHINATPEKLATALGRKVNIEYVDQKVAYR